MTPSRQELLERAYTILESLDLLTDIRRLADHEHTFRRFLEDVIEELEGA